MLHQQACSLDGNRTIEHNVTVEIVHGRRIVTDEFFIWRELNQPELSKALDEALQKVSAEQPDEVLIYPRSINHTHCGALAIAFHLGQMFAARSIPVGVYNYHASVWQSYPACEPVLSAAFVRQLSRKLLELDLVVMTILAPNRSTEKKRRCSERLSKLSAEMRQIVTAHSAGR